MAEAEAEAGGWVKTKEGSITRMAEAACVGVGF